MRSESFMGSVNQNNFQSTYGAFEECAAKRRNISCSSNVQLHRLFFAQPSHVRVTSKNTLFRIGLSHFFDVECRQEMFDALFFEVSDMMFRALIIT